MTEKKRVGEKIRRNKETYRTYIKKKQLEGKQYTENKGNDRKKACWVKNQEK